MDSLSGIAAFVRTAEARSFVGAARQLGITASAVGKSVARLEQSLGVRLLQRSTRRVQLTAEGAAFHARCRHILDELQDAEAMLASSARAPRGTLRVTLPTIGYRFLLPILPAFVAKYPALELDLDFNDRVVDVIDAGVDVAIRSGELADSRLMARRLGPFRFVLCASPGYLDEHGAPRTPADLAEHRCLRFRFPTTGKLQDWALRSEPTAAVDITRNARLAAVDTTRSARRAAVGTTRRRASRSRGTHRRTAHPARAALQLPTAFICNNIEALRGAALAGLGIAYLPDFLATDALASGALRSLLADYLVDPGQFWVVWPSSRQLSPKVRVFVDYISTRLFP